MKTKQTLKVLAVPYTKDELLDMAKKSMDLTLEIDRIEDQKKRITPLREEVTSLSKKMKQGFEERQVLCTVQYNTPHNGKKTIIRDDTGETVEILNMSFEELQEDFQFAEAEIIEETNLLTEGQKQLTTGSEIPTNEC